MNETKPFCEAVTRSDCPIGTGQYVLLIGGARAGVIDGGYRQTIVTAVNAHEKLLEALRAIREISVFDPEDFDSAIGALRSVHSEANSAIAAAEGR